MTRWGSLNWRRRSRFLGLFATFSCSGAAGVLFLIGVIGFPADAADSATGAASFTATEDTYVKSAKGASSATSPLGQETSLQVDNAPAVKRALIRFRVTGIPDESSVTSASLRLFVLDPSRKAGAVRAVEGGWSETTTTWSNAPSVGEKISDLVGPAIKGSWIEADVTAAVAGNGEFDFYVVTAASDGVSYSSSEAAANLPTLRVGWEELTPAAEPTAAPTPTRASGPTGTPTATPTPAAGPGTEGGGGSFQPSPPIQAAFFYPWFPNAWTQAGTFPYTNYTPSLGFYGSADDSTIDQQLELAWQAHIEAFIASWWGQGHHTDIALQHILSRSERGDSPYPGLRWALYYESEGYSDPSPSQILADLQYLASNVFSHPGYLRVDGRPVVFVYASGGDGPGMALRWKQAKEQFGGNIYLVLKVYAGYRQDPSQPDSWHQYGPAVGYDSQAPYSVSVSPGFWKVGEQPRLTRDPARFEADLRRMTASGAFWQLITTWNEWGEGTSVEPASQFGGAYLEILCRNLAGAAPCNRSAAAPTPTPTPAPTPAPTATATPVGGSDPVLVGAGDIASCGSAGDEATAKLLDGIAGTVFTAGDNVYDSGTTSEFANCYGPSWGRHKNRTRPAPGNHEYGTPGASGYFGYFGSAAGDPAKGYYSYDLGAWHIVVLNSNCSRVGGCGAGSPQEQWLRADLSAHPTKCSLAYWHHPRFSSGANHGSSTAVRDLFRALYDSNAEVIVNGHEHNYERFAPQDADGRLDQARGIRQFVVGTGGKNHYGFATPLPNSEVRNADTFGLLKLTLHPSGYDWRFVPEEGKNFTDSGSQACH